MAVRLRIPRRHEGGAAARDARTRHNVQVFADGENNRHPFVRDVRMVGGSSIVVPPCTPLANRAKGTRPSVAHAAKSEHAEPLVAAFVTALRQDGLRVATGTFGAHMVVTLANDGPVTLILESCGRDHEYI